MHYGDNYNRRCLQVHTGCRAGCQVLLLLLLLLLLSWVVLYHLLLQASAAVGEGLLPQPCTLRYAAERAVAVHNSCLPESTNAASWWCAQSTRM
jgi:hypothetical protein